MSKMKLQDKQKCGYFVWGQKNKGLSILHKYNIEEENSTLISEISPYETGYLVRYSNTDVNSIFYTIHYNSNDTLFTIFRLIYDWYNRIGAYYAFSIVLPNDRAFKIEDYKNNLQKSIVLETLTSLCNLFYKSYVKENKITSDKLTFVEFDNIVNKINLEEIKPWNPSPKNDGIVEFETEEELANIFINFRNISDLKSLLILPKKSALKLIGERINIDISRFSQQDLKISLPGPINLPKKTQSITYKFEIIDEITNQPLKNFEIIFVIDKTKKIEKITNDEGICILEFMEKVNFIEIQPKNNEYICTNPSHFINSYFNGFNSEGVLTIKIRNVTKNVTFIDNVCKTFSVIFTVKENDEIKPNFKLLISVNESQTLEYITDHLGQVKVDNLKINDILRISSINKNFKIIENDYYIVKNFESQVIIKVQKNYDFDSKPNTGEGKSKKSVFKKWWFFVGMILSLTLIIGMILYLKMTQKDNSEIIEHYRRKIEDYEKSDQFFLEIKYYELKDSLKLLLDFQNLKKDKGIKFSEQEVETLKGYYKKVDSIYIFKKLNILYEDIDNFLRNTNFNVSVCDSYISQLMVYAKKIDSLQIEKNKNFNLMIERLNKFKEICEKFENGIKILNGKRHSICGKNTTMWSCIIKDLRAYSEILNEKQKKEFELLEKYLIFLNDKNLKSAKEFLKTIEFNSDTIFKNFCMRNNVKLL